MALDIPDEQVQTVIASLRDIGFINADDRLESWDEKQPVYDSSAGRTREYRARKKANGSDPHPPPGGGLHRPQAELNHAATHGDVTVTGGDTPESDTDTDTERKRTSTRAGACASPARKMDLDAPGGADGPPILEIYYEKGRELLGRHSEQLLADVLTAKGSPERAIHAIEKAAAAKAPRRYLQQVAADPPFTPAAAPRKPTMLEAVRHMRRLAAEREADGNVVDFALLAPPSVRMR